MKRAIIIPIASILSIGVIVLGIILGFNQGDLSRQKNTISDLQSQLLSSQTQLKNAQSQIKNIQSELDDLQAQLTDTKNKLRDTEKQLEASQSSLSNAQSQLAAANHKNSDLQTQLDEAQQKIQDLQNKLANYLTPQGNNPPTPTIDLTRAYKYLENNFNPILNLVRESPDDGSTQDKTYWLANDNLLASHALEKENPDLSGKIIASIEKNGYKHDHYIEILFGNRTTEPVYAVDSQPKVIAQTDNYIIQTENITNIRMNDYYQYLDKLCYEALWDAYSNDRKKATALLAEAVSMWDGNGFADIVFQKDPNKNYATYKLAVFCYTAKTLGQLDTLPFKDKLLSTLNNLQDINGGFHTSYIIDSKGKLTISGSTNAETTSLVLIALDYTQKTLP
jgi:hypothetical protein